MYFVDPKNGFLRAVGNREDLVLPIDELLLCSRREMSQQPYRSALQTNVSVAIRANDNVDLRASL